MLPFNVKGNAKIKIPNAFWQREFHSKQHQQLVAVF
jgi:hypothetical protein